MDWNSTAPVRRRRIAGGGLAVLMVALLAAVAAGASAAGTTKHVTLTWWVSQTDVTLAKTTAADYHAQTGNTLKVQIIPDTYENNALTKIAAGQRPDVIFWQPTQGELSVVNAPKTLLPLDGEPYLSKIPKTISAFAGSFKGHTYAAVFGSPSIIGVVYNIPDFKKAGITSLPKNFAQFKAAAAKLKAAGITPLYDAGGDKWPTQWLVDQLMAETWTRGGLAAKLNKCQATFSDPRFVNAVSAYKSLVDSGDYNSDITTGTYAAQAEAVYSGSAAMAVQGQFIASQMLTTHSLADVNANVGFFGLSGGGNSPSFVTDQSESLAVGNTGNKAHEAASKAFVRWFMGPYYGTYVKKSKNYPGLLGYKAPAGVPNVIIEANQANARNGLPLMQMVLRVIPDIHLYLAAMDAGASSPTDVANQMTTQFQQLAKAQHVPGC